MLAFKDSKVSKQELMNALRGHRESDSLVQEYEYFKNGKGCAVGCSLVNFGVDPNDHSQFEPLFHIPEVLAHLDDKFFEGLPVKEAREWPERFIGSINEGSDLRPVYPLFQIWLLTDPDHGVIRFAKTDKERKVIQDSADLFLSFPNVDKEKALQVMSAYTHGPDFSTYADYATDTPDAAAYAAYHAYADYADYADDVADAAVYAVYAAYAEDSADAAALAADSADDAADADDAARRNHYVAMSDKLIELIEQAPSI